MSVGYEIYFDLVRIAHIFSGILWIGILYFFNFALAPQMPKMEASARPHFQLSIQAYTLNIFRWAALATVVFGIAFIVGKGIESSSYWESDRFLSIIIGGGIGLVMAYNVWFIIWPNMQKVFASVQGVVDGGTAAPDQPKWARRAFLASRTNTMLSVPMLYFMVAATHFPSQWT